MSLLYDAMEACVFMEKTRQPDGQGGYTIQWSDGAQFRAAITFSSSMEARIAQVSGVTSLYALTADEGTHLEYHDVFRRLSDGKIFRVTSDGDDKKTPAISTLRVLQVSAEEWRPA